MDYEKTCDDVVELVKRHSEGIPVSKIAVVFRQAYDRPLKKKELGFSSVAAFIESLRKQLYVCSGQIYYGCIKPEPSTPTGNDR